MGITACSAALLVKGVPSYNSAVKRFVFWLKGIPAHSSAFAPPRSRRAVRSYRRRIGAVQRGTTGSGPEQSCASGAGGVSIHGVLLRMMSGGGAPDAPR